MWGWCHGACFAVVFHVTGKLDCTKVRTSPNHWASGSSLPSKLAREENGLRVKSCWWGQHEQVTGVHLAAHTEDHLVVEEGREVKLPGLSWNRYIFGKGGGYRCSFQIICLNVHYICSTPSSFFFFLVFFFFFFFFFLLFLLFLAGNLGHLTCVTLPILCELMQDRTWAICTQLKLFQQFSFIFTSTDENPDVSQV